VGGCRGCGYDIVRSQSWWLCLALVPLQHLQHFLSDRFSSWRTHRGQCEQLLHKKRIIGISVAIQHTYGFGRGMIYASRREVKI
jgi:hypothetical protein